jgi:tripeptide aminopeptidase
VSRAVSHLADLPAADGPTGGEGPVSNQVIRKRKAAGCRTSWIRENRGRHALPAGFSIGNRVVRLPGTVDAPRILFCAHRDTGPLCRGGEAGPPRRPHRAPRPHGAGRRRPRGGRAGGGPSPGAAAAPAGIVGALGVLHWEADIFGVSAHAAIDPEGGVSAAVIASRAIADFSLLLYSTLAFRRTHG